MIVRSASTNKDIRTRLLKAIGRLADMNISSESRRIAVDELTADLQGKSLSKETFDPFDIETEIVKEANKSYPITPFNPIIFSGIDRL